MFKKILLLFTISLIFSSLTVFFDKRIESCSCNNVNRGFPIRYLGWNAKPLTPFDPCYVKCPLPNFLDSEAFVIRINFTGQNMFNSPFIFSVPTLFVIRFLANTVVWLGLILFLVFFFGLTRKLLKIKARKT